MALALTSKELSVVKNHLQITCNNLFISLNHQLSIVNVAIITKGTAPAYTIGINLFNVPIGEISIDKRLHSLLTLDELEFVVAHEASHIELNHLPPRIVADGVREIIKSSSKTDEFAKLLRWGWDFLNLLGYMKGELPMRAQITKDQELEADYLSIQLTGKKEAAVSCLRKLVSDDLTQPSHLWEVLGVPLPVMTMRERIDFIESRFPSSHW